jgi:hypothetical protein
VKKHTLHIETDEESLFYAILSSEKITRLAWLLNNQLHLHFERVERIEWYNELENENFYFSKFVYEDELNHLTYTLFANYSDAKILFTELRAMQYFILIEGGLSFFNEKGFLAQIKAIKEIQLTSIVDQGSLKQKPNLIL